MRQMERVTSRTSAAQVPVNIRATRLELDDETRAYIRKKLGQKLGRFAPSIERVTVRMRDVNGPRGGVDQVCRINVVLSRLPSVVFAAQAPALETGIDAALSGVARAVRRTVQRRRTKPLKAKTIARARRGD